MTAVIVIVLIVFFGAALLVLLSAIALYARLVGLRNAVKTAWSSVDAGLRGSHKHATGSARCGECHADMRHAVCSYNALVGNYNAEISAFPSNIIAALFKFEKEEPFDLGE